MSDFADKDYQVFKMFDSQWGLAAAGSPEHYNACTISWGSLGTLWTGAADNGRTVTVYLHPARYTQSFFKENDYFTVSFFPEEYKKALAYMGSHSGRCGDKAAAAGLTPVPFGEGVAFEEAELTFLCRKIYGHQFEKDSIAENVQEYYRTNPLSYPPDENGEWQPHWMFIGEIIDAVDKR